MSVLGKQAAIAALATMIMDHGGALVSRDLMAPAEDYVDSFRAPRRDRKREKFNPYGAKQKAQRAARKKQRRAK